MRIKRKLTLMEMIAVMVIIILLITVLLPAYVKGRECAKDLKCKSNLKGLSEALMAYANDNKGYAPMFATYGSCYTYFLQQGAYIDPDIKCNRTDNSTGKDVAKNVAIGRLLNYNQYPIKSNNILVCPSELTGVSYNKFVAAQMGYNTFNTNYYWQNATHYGIQRRITDLAWSGRNILYWLTVKKNNAARMPMLGDGIIGGNDFYASGVSHLYWGRHWGRSINISSTALSTNAIGAFGNARANLIMIDGHLRPVVEAEVFKENIWCVPGY